MRFRKGAGFRGRPACWEASEGLFRGGQGRFGSGGGGFFRVFFGFRFTVGRLWASGISGKRRTAMCSLTCLGNLQTGVGNG